LSKRFYTTAFRQKIFVSCSFSCSLYKQSKKTRALEQTVHHTLALLRSYEQQTEKERLTICDVKNRSFFVA